MPTKTWNEVAYEFFLNALTTGGATLSRVGTNRSITATTSAQTLMAANTNRWKFIISNDSTIDIWVNLGGTASAVAGSGNKKIAANGGYWELSGYSGAISIVAASGTPAITAYEL